MDPEIRILLCPFTTIALLSYDTEANPQETHENNNTTATTMGNTFHIPTFKPMPIPIPIPIKH